MDSSCHEKQSHLSDLVAIFHPWFYHKVPCLSSQLFVSFGLKCYHLFLSSISWSRRIHKLTLTVVHIQTDCLPSHFVHKSLLWTLCCLANTILSWKCLQLNRSLDFCCFFQSFPQIRISKRSEIFLCNQCAFWTFLKRGFIFQ